MKPNSYIALMSTRDFGRTKTFIEKDHFMWVLNDCTLLRISRSLFEALQQIVNCSWVKTLGN